MREIELVPDQNRGCRHPEECSQHVARAQASAGQQAGKQDREQRPQRGDQVGFGWRSELERGEIERVVAE